MAMRCGLVLAVLGLSATGCQILSYQWVTPASVSVGAVFTMEIRGTTDTTSGHAGAVLQVPNGFVVVDATAFPELPGAAAITITRDDPALLAPYTADPGCYLAAFSGMASVPPIGSSDSRLKVYLRAPVTAGTWSFELALASQNPSWQPQAGLVSFQTPGGSVVRTVQVTATPPAPPFALRDGVWAPPPVAGTGPFDVELADVDGDGTDDLVELLQSSFRWRRSIPGGFAPVTIPWFTFAMPSGMREFALADFDGDGHTDIALAVGTVLFGDGGGTTWVPVGAASLGVAAGDSVAVGDVDGDGLPDLAFADVLSTVVVLSRSNRTFVPWSQGLSPTQGSGPAVVHLVDLDGDGLAELISGPRATGGAQLRVYRSTAAAQWSFVAALPTSVAVAVLDLDGDGDREIVTPNGQRFDYSAQGVTSAPFQALGFSQAVVLDHDRDGRDDLFLGRGGASLPLELWRNVGSGALIPVPLPVSLGFTSLPEVAAVAAGDLDGDSYPDLAAVCDRPLAWRNTGNGAASYGEGCAAPGHAPALAVVGPLASGATASLLVTGSQANDLVVQWLGLSRTTWLGQPVLPLDLGIVGAPGCTLLAEPLLLAVAVAGATGTATLPCSVPVVPPTLEVSLFAQAAVLVPTANPFGAVFTRGLALKVQ